VASPHVSRDTILKYLKKEFQWRQDYVFKWQEVTEEGERLNREHTFTWSDVEAARKWTANLNPDNYKVLMYLITTGRSRQNIADALFLNSSTVKRKADAALDQIQQYLVAKHLLGLDIDFLVEPIDIGIRLELGLDN